MERIFINGGTPLNGSIEVSGMKNAALPILFSTILVEKKCVIENLPKISDIKTTLDILASMGAGITIIDDKTVEIETENIRCGTMPSQLAALMRGSYYVLGAELGRFGRSFTPCPGGCNFGERPIDQHIKGFEALGAAVTINDGNITAAATDGELCAASIYLDIPSVGATANIILAAVKTKGMTVIENAAREPHIVDLANFLNSAGAQISGAGTEVIKIRGVDTMHGVTYRIIPDMIEAGTYMIAAAATRGRLTITNIIPKHLESITAKLHEMGVNVSEDGDKVSVEGSDAPYKRIRVKASFYPAFPTDMNPQMCVLLCLAEGQSQLTDSVFEKRFKYVDELIRMGASITIQNNTITIDGKSSLHNANIRAVDLRAGVAMIIAGLATKGVTWIDDIYHIERGYENIIEKLKSVGANIKKVVIPEITTTNSH